MSRSTKKGPAIDPKLLKKVESDSRSGQKTVIKTWARYSTDITSDGWTDYRGT